jgi:4-hydroxybenzoate polyprenyltransferase
LGFCGLALFGAHLGWQGARLDVDDPAFCLLQFKSNRDAGLILFAGLLAEAALRAA